MKNKLYKSGALVAGTLGAFLPLVASAQLNYESQLATTTELATAVGADVLGTIYTVVGIVAGIIVFVWGIGYAFSKLGRKTGMRKF